MSKLIEQLAEAQASVKALTEQIAVAKTNEAAGKKQADDSLALAVKHEADLKAAIEAHKVEVTALQKQIQDGIAAHGVTKSELEKAQKTLANPAFAIALEKGKTQATAEGGNKETSNDSEFESREAAEMAYRKLDGDPIAQREFRAKHKQILGL